jgi:hypothetical protein
MAEKKHAAAAVANRRAARSRSRTWNTARQARNFGSVANAGRIHAPYSGS